MSDLPIDFNDEVITAHLRARAITFIDRVFDMAEDDMEGGDAATRTAAYKVVLPQLLALAKSAETAGGSAAEQARAQAQKVLDQMRGTIPGIADDAVNDGELLDEEED